MFLYLVQHAEAKREEEDPLRLLSPKGFADIRRVGSYLGGLGAVKVSRILHSSKPRAMQTARELEGYLKPEKGSSQTTGLEPLDDPQTWAKRLAKMEVEEDLMFVGHLPHLNRFASLLLCGDKSRNIINFRMGGVVCLRKNEDGGWSLEWMVAPDLLSP